MRVQHNIMAMAAYRNYTNNVSAMKKNLEKLSSGYKINRAGDDAAGLAISEKMRAQITGLETAQKNAKDGISLVQTAEGALTEVHDMLNRMVELATQSANGTYDNTTDRYQLQKELNQLRDEINRIADSSNFNGINLLDGSMDQGGVSIAEINGINRMIQQLANGQGPEGSGLYTYLDSSPYGDTSTQFGVDFTGLVFKGSRASTVWTSADITFSSAVTAQTAEWSGVSITSFKATTTGSAIAFKDVQYADGNTVTFDVKIEDTATTVTLTYKASQGKFVSATKTGASTGTVYTFTIDANGALKITAPSTATIGASAITDISLKAYALTGATDGSNHEFETTGGAVTAGEGLSFKEPREASDPSGSLSFSLSDLVEGDKFTIGTTAFSITAEDLEDLDALAAKIIAAATGCTSNSVTGKASYADGQMNIKFSKAGGTLNDFKPLMAFTTRSADLQKAVSTFDFKIAGQTLATGIKVKADAKASEIAKAVLQAIADDTTVTETVATINGVNYKLTLSGSELLFELTDTPTKENNNVNFDWDVSNFGGDGTVEQNHTAGTKPKKVAAVGGSTIANTVFEIKLSDLKNGTKITIGSDSWTIAIASTPGSDTSKIYLTESEAKDLNAALTKIGKSIAGMHKGFIVGVNDGSNKDVKTGITVHHATTGTKYDTVEKLANLFHIQVGNELDTTKGLTLQIGDTNDSFNQLHVSIRDCHTNMMGTEGGNSIADISIATQSAAADAIKVIKDAINYVSDVRGTLGATQNRLDHTINNLSVMTENIQDAESTIRDTDIAEEMMAYTKNNILIQSAQAMLAQANQVPQGVLQLLQ